MVRPSPRRPLVWLVRSTNEDSASLTEARVLIEAQRRTGPKLATLVKASHSYTSSQKTPRGSKKTLLRLTWAGQDLVNRRVYRGRQRRCYCPANQRPEL